MVINRLEFIKNDFGIWVLYVNEKELVIADRENRLTDQEAKVINKRLKSYTAVKLTMKEIKELATGLILEVRGRDN